jgi:predicted transcriptional regulator
MEIKPTESELEILQVLWKKGEATVRDVHQELAINKSAGYTTTLKLMQIMDEKGLLDKILSTVFKGSTSELVIQALGNHRASKDEIDAIKSYLERFGKGE